MRAPAIGCICPKARSISSSGRMASRRRLRAPTARRSSASTGCWPSCAPSCRCCARRWAIIFRRSKARSPGAWRKPAGRIARSIITPMAAVAGAVAEAVLAAMTAAAPLTRAYVNDGGDIALHLTPGTSLAIGVVRSLEKAVPEGEVHDRATTCRCAASPPAAGTDAPSRSASPMPSPCWRATRPPPTPPRR